MGEQDTSATLSEVEKARIRQETQLALAVFQQANPPAAPKSRGQRTMAFLSNGFVVLIVGALITSLAVPWFQRVYEARQKRAALEQDCFAEVLAFSNSIWQEYYLLIPLVQEREITKVQYNEVLRNVADVKLRRYDALAKIESLAIAFRKPSAEDQQSEVEVRIEEYASQVNGLSTEINDWLRNLYCAPNRCLSTATAPVDPKFSPYDSFIKIRDQMDQHEKRTKEVAGLMVQRIKMPD